MQEEEKKERKKQRERRPMQGTKGRLGRRKEDEDRRKAERLVAQKWVRKTFCLVEGNTMKKCDVYDAYVTFCKTQGINPSGPATFGRFVLVPGIIHLLKPGFCF